MKFSLLATFERKTSFDIVNFCEDDLDSDYAACAPLMCCVLGGWNGVTIEDYDGRPKGSPHIVTVEGAYLFMLGTHAAMLYDGAMTHRRTHFEPRQLVRQCLVADGSKQRSPERLSVVLSA